MIIKHKAKNVKSFFEIVYNFFRRSTVKSVKKYITDYAFIAVGSFVLAAAISLFLTPCKISTGGVSGVGMVLYYVFKVKMSVSTFVINIILFFFGFRTLTKSAVIKTLAGIAFFSLSLEITDMIAALIPDTVAQITSDLWIASIFGGILVGVGVGLVVLKEGSTGGSDFAALMLHKLFPYLSVATFILLIDSCIIIVSGIVFKDYAIMFYSVVSLYISSKVTDYIIVRGNFAKSVHIVSSKNEEIAQRVMDEMERGVTAIHSHGCYDKKEGEMLMCIVRGKEIPKLLGIVRCVDKSAFTVISDVKEVRGLGFIEE